MVNNGNFRGNNYLFHITYESRDFTEALWENGLTWQSHI